MKFKYINNNFIHFNHSNKTLVNINKRVEELFSLHLFGVKNSTNFSLFTIIFNDNDLKYNFTDNINLNNDSNLKLSFHIPKYDKEEINFLYSNTNLDIIYEEKSKYHYILYTDNNINILNKIITNIKNIIISEYFSDIFYNTLSFQDISRKIHFKIIKTNNKFINNVLVIEDINFFVSNNFFPISLIEFISLKQPIRENIIAEELKQFIKAKQKYMVLNFFKVFINYYLLDKFGLIRNDINNNYLNLSLSRGIKRRIENYKIMFELIQNKNFTNMNSNLFNFDFFNKFILSNTNDSSFHYLQYKDLNILEDNIDNKLSDFFDSILYFKKFLSISVDIFLENFFNKIEKIEFYDNKELYIIVENKFSFKLINDKYFEFDNDFDYSINIIFNKFAYLFELFNIKHNHINSSLFSFKINKVYLKKSSDTNNQLIIDYLKIMY